MFILSCIAESELIVVAGFFFFKEIQIHSALLKESHQVEPIGLNWNVT